jgi:hypothetical protein
MSTPPSERSDSQTPTGPNPHLYHPFSEVFINDLSDGFIVDDDWNLNHQPGLEQFGVLEFFPDNDHGHEEADEGGLWLFGDTTLPRNNHEYEMGFANMFVEFNPDDSEGGLPHTYFELTMNAADHENAGEEGQQATQATFTRGTINSSE